MPLKNSDGNIFGPKANQIGTREHALRQMYDNHNKPKPAPSPPRPVRNAAVSSPYNGPYAPVRQPTSRTDLQPNRNASANVDTSVSGPSRNWAALSVTVIMFFAAIVIDGYAKIEATPLNVTVTYVLLLPLLGLVWLVRRFRTLFLFLAGAASLLYLIAHH